MIKVFKFLEGDTGYVILPDDMATWVWDFMLPYTAYYNERNRYELVTEQFHGIIGFLEQFPRGYVAVVNRILNPQTMIFHDRDNNRFPWGFNIQTDLIEVTYYKFMDSNN